jgi:hypothetical protein
MRDSAPHFRTIKPVVYIFGLCGGALFIALLIREGAGQVGTGPKRRSVRSNDSAGLLKVERSCGMQLFLDPVLVHRLDRDLAGALGAWGAVKLRHGGNPGKRRASYSRCCVSRAGSRGGTGRGLYSAWKSVRYSR